MNKKTCSNMSQRKHFSSEGCMLSIGYESLLNVKL